MKAGGKIVLAVLLVAGFSAGLVRAQVVSKIDGLFFGDYYFNAQNHADSQESLNAFTIRRIYFTFENNLTENIKTRFRLESEQGEFGSSTKINPFVKHAYLEWSNLIPNHKLYLGIAETNAFKNAEELWGYRSIEKTVMDLNKISSSADMGIALKGDLSMNLHHWLTLMNGPGYGSAEVDKYKKVGYALWVTLPGGWIIEGYADYERQDPDNTAFKYAKDFSGSKGYYTVKGFAGTSGLHYTLGFEWFRKTNQESGIRNAAIQDEAIVSAEKADVVKSGYSVFGSWITPVPKLKVFGRYDYFDPNTNEDVGTAFANGLVKGGKDDETSLIIAGFDYIPVGNLHLMPNIVYKSYAAPGTDADLTARLTLYYKFNSGKIIVE
ncbi:hypothetical protein JW948_17270 [bacterium]|nr:hypothetical protein [bacterium]